jgi:hypothetical protein
MQQLGAEPVAGGQGNIASVHSKSGWSL